MAAGDSEADVFSVLSDPGLPEQRDGVTMTWTLESQVTETQEEGQTRCDPCSAKNENAAASWYCVPCRKYVCDACLENHSTDRTLRRHRTVALADMTPGTRRQAALEMEDCEEHLHNVKDTFCVTHKMAYCARCILDKHR